jgi:hypothetical protein
MTALTWPPKDMFGRRIRPNDRVLHVMSTQEHEVLALWLDQANQTDVSLVTGPRRVHSADLVVLPTKED